MIIKKGSWIIFSWVHPLTGEFLSGAKMWFSRDEWARGKPRKQVLAFKPIAKQWIGFLEPKLKLEIKP